MKFQQKKIMQLMDIIGVFLVILAVHFVIGAFNGKWPWSGNAYNSYLLQAESWLHGRLDLGQNYEYLELAVFKNKYFVSFPPFPSYVLLPFVAILGKQTPEGWIAFFAMLLGAFYALRIAWHYFGQGAKAIFWTSFLYIGTNVLYITLDAGVWFIAQNFALTLSLMAIFYAIQNKGGWSLFFWGCSVGCRPLQIVCFPILFYILYKNLKQEKPQRTLLSMIKEKYYWAIPVLLIALSYMLLNYARFGNPIEFGHNYLPEFTREKHGQFHQSYILHNIKSLFRLPQKGENGLLTFYKFDGNCIFLVIPLFVSYFVYWLRSWIKKQKISPVFTLVLPCLIALHIIGLCAHRTMGGFHFGHRYINDVTPYLYWGILVFAGCITKKTMPEEIAETPIAPEKTTEPVEPATSSQETEAQKATIITEEAQIDSPTNETEKIEEAIPDYTYPLHIAFCVFGLALNLIGTIAVNMGWV